MDIAITLPRTLWNKIVTGEKTIELRKNFPQKFQLEIDRVYVCVKGTALVAGYFSVSHFEACHHAFICTHDDILKKIAVPVDWIDMYFGKKNWAYLWHIKHVVRFSGLGCHRSLYLLDKNPQSFVYL